jgi:hypothetical protein
MSKETNAKTATLEARILSIKRNDGAQNRQDEEKKYSAKTREAPRKNVKPL